MKALTIIQPWATLIASGHKMNETRSWKTNYRGEVLIHAGKNPKDYTSGVYIDDPDGPYFHEAGIEHQCSYGSIMNLLEIRADGSIQGYLSAKQTLRIIERVKARESPR